MGPLLEKLQKKYGKEYTSLHTHPSGNLIPSPQDIVSFLAQKNKKSSIIVPLVDREASGYFVMRKNTNYNLSELEERNLIDSIEPYYQSVLQDIPKEIAKSLKKIANKYNFSYRFFPAKGFALSKEYQGFKNSKQPLEAKLAVIVSILLSLFLLLNLSIINGNVTYRLPSEISNTIVTELLIACACLIAIIYLFRNNLTFFIKKLQ